MLEKSINFEALEILFTKKNEVGEKKRKCFHQGHFFDKWEMLLVSRSILSVVPHQTLATTPKCAPWTHPCRDQPRFVRMRWWMSDVWKNHFYILLVNIWDMLLLDMFFFFDSFDRKHHKFRSLVHGCWWVVSPTRLFQTIYIVKIGSVRSARYDWKGFFTSPIYSEKNQPLNFWGLGAGNGMQWWGIPIPSSP